METQEDEIIEETEALASDEAEDSTEKVIDHPAIETLEDTTVDSINETPEEATEESSEQEEVVAKPVSEAVPGCGVNSAGLPIDLPI